MRTFEPALVTQLTRSHRRSIQTQVEAQTQTNQHCEFSKNVNRRSLFHDAPTPKDGNTRKDRAAYASLSSKPNCQRTDGQTHRTKTTDANKATQAAFHIRVFERTVRPDQPANQSTLYGGPNTKRKSQTRDFLENQTSEHQPTKQVQPIW